ncbi:hypothetical protein JAAARDRAFT_160141 [Jaapia argillacea MUCL 33604]|uniref:RINT-1 family protein n=1 Tax=Jaapia argillacea MUCL 33604 TaxID=933084 RepID=A0A067PM02_9AGAM|nr:hypothetical protein JAAARDRAFT_160141 [Jaapia argillacea MUCL 33604]
MASAEICRLLAPANTQISEQRALELINWKYPSWDALPALDVLRTQLDQAQAHSTALNTSLAASQDSVAELTSATRSALENHLHTAQELSLLRHSLADELAFLSDELVSTLGDAHGERGATLLEELEGMHRSLKELESVKGYVQVVQRALQLSESSINQLRKAPTTPLSPTSLSSYQSLQSFVSSVSQACSDVEDGGESQGDEPKLHLILFLEKIRDRTWIDIKGVLAAPLLEAAEKLKWPMRVDYISASPEDRKAFESAFLNILRLQSIGDKLHSSTNQKQKTQTLYPLQTLVHPIALRFKYHFDTSRGTNRVDKPEWYFTHILNVITEHRPFMDGILQLLIDSTEYKGINAWQTLTTLLLPLPTSKIQKTVPQILHHPSLLAHLVGEALAFDRGLREVGYEGGDGKVGDEGWEGVSEVVLGRKEWFDAWVEGEKRFAEDQYHEIISASDAWVIADDSSGDPDDDDGMGGSGIGDRELRSTNSARRVRALLEQVTDRYASLPSPLHKTHFLTTIQLPLLQTYHSRISSSLDAFETLSSAFVRAVPGAITMTGSFSGAGGEAGGKGDGRRLTGGVVGVERLVKGFVSARWVERGMEGWGDDLFFLELWNEINSHASLRARAHDNPLLPSPSPSPGGEGVEGTLLDVLVEEYRKLGERAEEMIVQQVYGEVESALRPHWVALGSPDPEAELSGIPIPPSLISPISILTSHLTFLHSTLPQSITTTLYRRISARLSQHILQRAVMFRGREKVTRERGWAIQREGELWVDTCQLALSSPSGVGGGGASGGAISRTRVEAPWRRLIQAGRIIGAEGERWKRVVEATVGSGGRKMLGDGEWEEEMMDVLGYCELSREEVGQVLRMRVDFEG